MMSEKMNNVHLDPLPCGVYEDVKTRFKHQSLFKDYQELQKEIEARSNRLDSVKQRKLILLAEVRFLRQRRKYLLNNKSTNSPQERGLVLHQKFETQLKNYVKNKKCGKASALCKLPPPNHVANQKGKVNSRKEAAPRKASPVSAVNHRNGLHSRKAFSVQNLTPVADLKQRMSQVIDLNQKERTQAGKETTSRSRAPTFDLNETEDEFHNSCDVGGNNDLKKGLTRDGTNEEQLNDFKQPLCRNIGDGSSRMGKRKISWQDPVALRV